MPKTLQSIIWSLFISDEIKPVEFENANWENDIYSVAKNSDCLVILTEWTEFKSMDLKKISDIMNKPIIIDFRNLFSLDEMEKLKIEYHSIGREAVNFNKETK